MVSRSLVSGYSGGVKLHPTYRRIGDHTEVVEVHYNTKLITLSDILEVFFENMTTLQFSLLDTCLLSFILMNDRKTKLNTSSSTIWYEDGISLKCRRGM